MRENKGFTLVELLVVISIIVILSAIGLTIYSQAQKSARLARRVRDLKAIQTALETYNTQNGKYPDTVGVWFSECTVGGWSTKVGNAVIPGLVPTFMPAFPSDPQMDKTNGKNCYAYRSNSTDYKVINWNATEHSASDLGKNPTIMDPVHSAHPEKCATVSDDYKLAVYSANGRCWL